MEKSTEDNAPSPEPVEGEEGSLFDTGQSGIYTGALRGQVQYAYVEGEWLTLMYDNPKRVMKVNTAKGLLVEGNYYEQRKH